MSGDKPVIPGARTLYDAITDPGHGQAARGDRVQYAAAWDIAQGRRGAHRGSLSSRDIRRLQERARRRQGGGK